LNAEQPERGQLGAQLGGKMLLLIPLADVRANLGFRELADGATEQDLLLCGTEVHVPLAKTDPPDLPHPTSLALRSCARLRRASLPHRAIPARGGPVGVRGAVLDEPAVEQTRIRLPPH